MGHYCEWGALGARVSQEGRAAAAAELASTSPKPAGAGAGAGSAGRKESSAGGLEDEDLYVVLSRAHVLCVCAVCTRSFSLWRDKRVPEVLLTCPPLISPPSLPPSSHSRRLRLALVAPGSWLSVWAPCHRTLW
jgi:hypothetical protein